MFSELPASAFATRRASAPSPFPRSPGGFKYAVIISGAPLSLCADYIIIREALSITLTNISPRRNLSATEEAPPEKAAPY